MSDASIFKLDPSNLKTAAGSKPNKTYFVGFHIMHMSEGRNGRGEVGHGVAAVASH